MGVSVYLLTPDCALCVCVSVISNQSTSKKPHVPDLSKLDALLHATHIKVLRCNMCTSMISLSKKAYQVWHSHPFSHSPIQTGRGWTTIEKGGRQYRGGGGVCIIYGRLGPLCYDKIVTNY